jgi:hypothetical protein
LYAFIFLNIYFSALVAPHVAGLAAVVLAREPSLNKASDLKQRVIETGISGVLRDLPTDTVNLLASMMQNGATSCDGQVSCPAGAYIGAAGGIHVSPWILFVGFLLSLVLV